MSWWGSKRCGAKPRKKWAPKGGGLKGWGAGGVGAQTLKKWSPKLWGPEGWGPKISRFFPLSHHIFLGVPRLYVCQASGALIRVSTCGSSLGPVWVHSDNCSRGFTRQPENSKLAHLSAPALQTPPKFHETTPREGRRERILWREREKKSAKFWAPHPSGLHPSGPHFFWVWATLRAPTLRAPTLRAPTGFGPLACKKKKPNNQKSQKKTIKKIQTINTKNPNNYKNKKL